MTVHLHTARWQPATRYTVPGLDMEFQSSPGSLIWCRCCKRTRRAANVELQVYYDMTNARCVGGKGCKQPRKR